MINVAFKTLGCKVNTYETNIMRETIPHIFNIVDFNEKADIYIINTCSVTHIADRKSRQMICRAYRKNKNALIVAVGCFVDNVIFNNEQFFLEKNFLYISNKNKNIIWDIIKNKIKYNMHSLIKQNNSTYNLSVRGFLKIEDGCNNFCSYCIIPYLRGRVQVRNIESVIKDAIKMSKQGIKEIVLTGINITSCGEDYLIDVIKKISKITNICRIRLGSIEQSLISEKLLKKIINDNNAKYKFCPEFHLSLQSGSNKVLKLMNRHYTNKEFEKKVDLIRKYFPLSTITTDIIVGFPGESDKDFIDTVNFVKKIRFFSPHIFIYSDRKGTVASSMSDKIDDLTKKKREALLINECDKITNNILKNELKFEKQNILVQEIKEIDNKYFAIGHTKTYIKIIALIDNKLLKNNQNATNLIGKEIDVDIIDKDLL